jgi:hypothetical protein
VNKNEDSALKTSVIVVTKSGREKQRLRVPEGQMVMKISATKIEITGGWREFHNELLNFLLFAKYH